MRSRRRENAGDDRGSDHDAEAWAISPSAFAGRAAHGMIVVQESEAAMGALEVPVVGVGAEALDAYLSSDRSPPDSMGLSDLDGFLTAVAIGPELVMPSEGLPIVWGGEEPVFADDGEAQAVICGDLCRRNTALPRR